VGAGDGDEAQRDRRGLRDLAAVGPLHALELGPRRAQEVDHPVASRAGARRDAAPGGLGLGLLVLARDRPDRRGARAAALVLELGGLAAGAGDDRRLGEVDPGRAVLPVVRDAFTARLLPLELLGLAIAGALAVACHQAATGSPGDRCGAGTTCSTCAA